MPDMKDEYYGIGWVVKELGNGGKVCRRGWNGKGMYIFLVRDWDTDYGLELPSLPFVAMKTVDGGVVPWLCSQTDLLAQDWEIYDG